MRNIHGYLYVDMGLAICSEAVDMEDKELEEIMKKKMREYMERLAKNVEEKSIEKDRDIDIFEKAKPLFTKDGYQHLINISKRNRTLAEKMLSMFAQLIYLGYLSPPIDYILVEKLRRKLVGEKGKIYVYKKGELKELGESLKED